MEELVKRISLVSFGYGICGLLFTIIVVGRNYQLFFTRRKVWFSALIINTCFLIIQRLLLGLVGRNPFLIAIYVYTIFSNGIIRVVSITELLKLFSPICPQLSPLRVNCLHAFHILVHTLTALPVLFLNSAFQSSTDHSVLAQWFRWGSPINVFYVSGVVVVELSLMQYLMDGFVHSSRNTSPDYNTRFRTCVKMLMGLNAIYILLVIICTVAVMLDGPLGSPGNLLYQNFIFIMITTSLFASILGPLVFDRIVAMKFHESGSKSSRQCAIHS
jgi:hypothetical protein